MTYAEKLRDPRWQRRRLEVLSAANFTCQDCGSKDKTLHVHHGRYERGKEPWEMSQLRCVCFECHDWRQCAEEVVKEAVGRFPANLLVSVVSMVHTFNYIKPGSKRMRLLAYNLKKAARSEFILKHKKPNKTGGKNA